MTEKNKANKSRVNPSREPPSFVNKSTARQNAQLLFAALGRLDETAYRSSDGRLIDLKTAVRPAAETAVRPAAETAVRPAAASGRQSRSGSGLWARRILKAAAALLALLIVVLAVRQTGPKPGPAVLLAAPHYPEMPPYPEERAYINKMTGRMDEPAYRAARTKWEEAKAKQQADSALADRAYFDFTRSISPVLWEHTEQDNMIYSPSALYLALALVAESSGSESRAQLLDVLQQEDSAGLARTTRALWNSQYSADGISGQVLATSLWLRADLPYQEALIKRLAEQYYASTYQGEMGSAELNRLLRTWLDTQTGGQLKEQTAAAALDPQAVLAVFSAAAFQAKWSEQFFAKNNSEGIFHGRRQDQKVTFMKQSGNATYYWAEHFAALRKDLQATGEVWFVLPDEAVSFAEILKDRDFYDLTCRKDGASRWAQTKELKVNLSLPKFDLNSSAELKEALQQLGLRAIFSAEKADFSPLLGSDVPGTYLSEVKQSARLAVDEEGVKGAGLAEIQLVMAAPPLTDEIDFVLDRPFLVVVNGADGRPVFIGIINQL